MRIYVDLSVVQVDDPPVSQPPVTDAPERNEPVSSTTVIVTIAVHAFFRSSWTSIWMAPPLATNCSLLLTWFVPVSTLPGVLQTIAEHNNGVLGGAGNPKRLGAVWPAAKAGLGRGDEVRLLSAAVHEARTRRGGYLDIDTAWTEVWRGKQQVRTYELDGKRLTLIVAPQPSATQPGKTLTSRSVWEKID